MWLSFHFTTNQLGTIVLEASERLSLEVAVKAKFIFDLSDLFPETTVRAVVLHKCKKC